VTVAGPLESLKVIDLTQGWAGPFCTMQLGDMGATVIKVEPPEGDFTRRLGPPFPDGESLPFLSVNRSKRSVVLDLETPSGVAAVQRLIQDADVLVESYAPGEADSMGIGYEALKAINPGLIYATITPFGQTGPYRDWAGSEIVAQSLAGFTPHLGKPGQAPVMLGGEQAAIFAGKFFFHGILAALICRERTGVAQRVDASLLGGMMAAQVMAYPGDDYQFPSDTKEEAPPPPAVNSLGFSSIRTKDMVVDFAFFVSGYTPNDDAWHNFFVDLGAQDMAEDPRFNDRYGRAENAAALISGLEGHCADKGAQEVWDIIHRYGGMGAPYHTMNAVMNHPHAIANDMVVTVQHPTLGALKMVGMPWQFEGSPAAITLPPPTLGQHTVEVLQQAGV